MILRWNLKQYRQKITKKDIAFLNNRYNIKDQIIAWITAELEYLEKNKHVLSLENHAKSEIAHVEKIALDLSVEQFAVLIKIAHLTGLIKNEELKPVVNLLSQHFSTKRASNPSSGNLYNCIFKTVIQDVDKVKPNFKRWLRSFL